MNILDSIISMVISSSVAILFLAILINFLIDDKKRETTNNKKSIVATFTMICFYIVYYIILRFQIGKFNFVNYTFIIFGTVMIVLGCFINIFGRFNLGKNWSDHIKIYDTHTLVIEGMYKYVRHPLYASIILMLFGGCIAYRNWLNAILTVFIFIPFIYYRAKQEEQLLSQQFEQYKNYKNTTGMFFPKIRR